MMKASTLSRLGILIAILSAGVLLTGAKPPPPPDPWVTAGNAGTNAATDFIGTTDSQALAFRTNNAERMRIDTTGNVTISGAVGAAGFTQGGSSTLSNSISGNAATATTATSANTATTASALTANPADCAAGQFANAIAASGDLTCAQVSFTNLAGAATDAQIPDNITINTAATATTLAANPADCPAGQFANAIESNGDLTCATIGGGTGGAGAIGTIAKFTSPTTVGDSVIVENRGSVGIGTTNPGSVLHVANGRDAGGALLTAEGDSSSGVYMRVRNNDGNPANPIESYVTAIGADNIGGRAIFHEALNVNRVDFRVNSRFELTIHSNDNVGIGLGERNEVPNAKLHVRGGDVYVDRIGSGVILRSTDGGPNCFRLTVNNSGAISTTAVVCP